MFRRRSPAGAAGQRGSSLRYYFEPDSVCYAGEQEERRDGAEDDPRGEAGKAVKKSHEDTASL
jgi:hypothetical protein